MNKLAALACITMIACGGKAKPPAPATSLSNTASDEPAAPAAPSPAAKTLYQRLGGKAAVTAVVHDFVERLGADARIKYRFLNTDLPKLETLLIEFVSVAAGSGGTYTGQDMETSHAGMELVDEEFDALVEDLVTTLDKFKVPAHEKGELLGALGPLKPQIVTPPDRLKPVDPSAIAKATAVSVRITDDTASGLLQAAIIAAKRGQRNYADQLFTRVETLVGAKLVAAAAPTFRDGAPPRIESPLHKTKDTGPQPTVVGNSDVDEPSISGPGKGPASLSGTLTVAGKPLDGLGTIMLFPIQGVSPKRKPKQRTVEQRDKTFLPHVLAVPPGSTVAFPNFDGVYHNVFSISSTKKFDVGLYKDGDTRELKFEKPGIVRLGCNIHAKMSAYILVVDAPHYVVVDGAHPFNFRSLTPGKYKVRAWSEHSAAPTESQITIKPGANSLSFDTTADAPTGPGEDKFGMTRQPVATR